MSGHSCGERWGFLAALHGFQCSRETASRLPGMLGVDATCKVPEDTRKRKLHFSLEIARVLARHELTGWSENQNPDPIVESMSSCLSISIFLCPVFNLGARDITLPQPTRALHLSKIFEPPPHDSDIVCTRNPQETRVEKQRQEQIDRSQKCAIACTQNGESASSISSKEKRKREKGKRIAISDTKPSYISTGMYP